jgi:hypothetical protein
MKTRKNVENIHNATHLSGPKQKTVATKKQKRNSGVVAAAQNLARPQIVLFYVRHVL